MIWLNKKRRVDDFFLKKLMIHLNVVFDSESDDDILDSLALFGGEL